MRFCNQNHFEFQIRRDWKNRAFLQLSDFGNFKSGGIEKIELSYNFQISGNETLIIADYKLAKSFKFAMLDIKQLKHRDACIVQ